MCDGECQALKQSAQCQHKNSSMAGQCGTPPSDNENGTSTKKRTNIREEDENDTYSRRMGVSERERGREGGRRGRGERGERRRAEEREDTVEERRDERGEEKGERRDERGERREEIGEMR